MAGLPLGWEEVGSKRTKLVVFTVNDPEDTIGEFKSSFQPSEELEFLLWVHHPLWSGLGCPHVTSVAGLGCSHVTSVVWSWVPPCDLCGLVLGAPM